MTASDLKARVEVYQSVQSEFEASIDGFEAAVEGLESAVRPTEELDMRATLVLLTCVALIALSLAGSKPDNIQVLGFTVAAGHWTIIGAALIVALVYWSMNLFHAYRWFLGAVERKKNRIRPIRQQLTYIVRELPNDLIELNEEARKLRQSIWDDYTRREDALDQDLDKIALEMEGLSESSGKWWELNEREMQIFQQSQDLIRERDQKLVAEGLNVHDALVEELLKEIGKPPKHLLRLQESVVGMQSSLEWSRKQAVLGFRLPVGFATVAVAVFVLAVVSPGTIEHAGDLLQGVLYGQPTEDVSTSVGSGGLTF